MTRTALITGGTRGIGAAISTRLKEDGFQVIANYHSNDNRAENFKKNTGIKIAKFDISNLDAVKVGINNIQDEIGPIDILINNAGITKDKMLHKMSYEDWCNVINNNLSSCFNTCRVLINSMRERGFGRIINISSINAQQGQVGQTNYSATKSGLIGFSKSLALENAKKGITVNVIAPGYIDTEMLQSMPKHTLDQIIEKIPVGRLGAPEEIARAVSFLTADSAGFITGSTLSINGGQFMG